jgi:hypothetical protein
MTTNWRVVNSNGSKPEDSLGAFKQLGKDIVDGCDAAIDQALNKNPAMRDAEATFGSPGAPGIEIRREGFIFRHDNPEDRKRFEVLKTNRDRQILTARHVKDVGAYIATGQQFVVDVAVHLRETIAELPEDMQSLEVSLTNAGLQILSGTYIEGAKFNAEMGLREITQATMPGQEQQQ